MSILYWRQRGGWRRLARLWRRSIPPLSPFPLTAIGEAPGQHQQKHACGDATTCGVHKQQRGALDSDPVPVVETEADIARCQGARSAFLRNPQPSSLEQSREGLSASVD